MKTETAVREILAGYPDQVQPHRISELGGAGGFSGACFWRLASPAGALCLRRWPTEHPTAERLEKIHSVLRHAASCGLSFLPVPIPDRRGRSFVNANGTLWELAPWLPGEADYHRRPTRRKLEAAMASLARFHSVAATSAWVGVEQGVSPGIVERRAELARSSQEDVARIAREAQRDPRSAWASRAGRLLAIFPQAITPVATRLEEAVTYQVPQQPCIRDIWHDHVLYVGEEVSGMIDFGAMRRDCVAGDVARLLGSLAGDDPNQREAGMDAYCRVRPLQPTELRLVQAFDMSSVALSGMLWLRWHYLEGRQFDEPERVFRRVDENVARLEHLVRVARHSSFP